MDRTTVERYESDGARWAANRAPVRQKDAKGFARRVGRTGLRLDVGAGAGRYTADLGPAGTVLAFDAAHTMLGLLRADHPDAPAVQGDVEALPFRRGTLGGAWANMTYHHLPRSRLPLALADLHGALAVGAPLDLQVVHGDHDGPDLPGDDIGGRWFSTWTAPDLAHVVTGAGFAVESVDVVDESTRHAVTRVRGTRARTLADTVGPGMRLLVCGLNPSVYSADRGVGYARPGNRFWKAVVAAGLVAPERALRPRDVLAHDGIGITDLCKRATVASAELTRDEYVAGGERVAWLVEELRPGAVCFVGLEGWRAAVDRKAVAGPQPQPFGGRPAYVLPSTSGLNAHSRLDDLVAHFRAVARLADRSR
jgi:TDG/mug DNA glycosylase family protein